MDALTDAALDAGDVPGVNNPFDVLGELVQKRLGAGSLIDDLPRALVRAAGGGHHALSRRRFAACNCAVTDTFGHESARGGICSTGAGSAGSNFRPEVRFLLWSWRLAAPMLRLLRGEPHRPMRGLEQ